MGRTSSVHRTRVVGISLVLILFTAPPSLVAQADPGVPPVTVGPRILIATHAPWLSGATRVLSDTVNERFAVIWRTVAEVNGYLVHTLHGQWLNTDGSLYGSAFTVPLAFPDPFDGGLIEFDPINNRFLLFFGVRGYNTSRGYGQFIRADGSLDGGSFLIPPPQVTLPLFDPNSDSYGVAYLKFDPVHQNFFTVFSVSNRVGPLGNPTSNLIAQRLNLDGSVAGAPIVVTNYDYSANNCGAGARLRAFGSDADAGRFLIVWTTQSTGCVPTNGQIVSGDGTATGPAFSIAAAGSPVSTAFDSENSRFLVVFGGVDVTVTGQLVNADGTLYGGSFLSTLWDGVHGSLSTLYDAASGKFQLIGYKYLQQGGWMGLGQLLNPDGSPYGQSFAVIDTPIPLCYTLGFTTVAGSAETGTLVVSDEAFPPDPNSPCEVGSAELVGRFVKVAGVVEEDTTPPVVSCGGPDGLWHSEDVRIWCSAEDAGSGLANPDDSSFELTTAVPGATDTTDAQTGTREVCDVAGNCVAVGPIGGNYVDKKAPFITVNSPAETGYLLNQLVPGSYACTDGGSGIASCAGPVPSGTGILTGAVGSHSFSVAAADNVGNSSTWSVQYSVSYNICPLYDQTKAVKSGATIPVKLQLCDAASANVSDPTIPVTTVQLVPVSSGATSEVQDAGNANPDNNFRYNASLAGYIFNLKTRGLPTGTWKLEFTAGADGVTHAVQFQVR